MHVLCLSQQRPAQDLPERSHEFIRPTTLLFWMSNGLEMNHESDHSAKTPLTGIKFVLGTFAVALATFMNVLDSSIANVAIPTLSGNLGVSVDEGTWVITLFAAANAVSIPL